MRSSGTPHTAHMHMHTAHSTQHTCQTHAATPCYMSPVTLTLGCKLRAVCCMPMPQQTPRLLYAVKLKILLLSSHLLSYNPGLLSTAKPAATPPSSTPSICQTKTSNHVCNDHQAITFERSKCPACLFRITYGMSEKRRAILCENVGKRTTRPI